MNGDKIAYTCLRNFSTIISILTLRYQQFRQMLILDSLNPKHYVQTGYFAKYIIAGFVVQARLVGCISGVYYTATAVLASVRVRECVRGRACM